MGKFIGFPQPVQDLPFLHLGPGLLLLQKGDLPLHGQQLVVLVPAGLVGTGPLSFQFQPLPVQPLDIGLLLRPLGLDALQKSLLLGDLPVQLLILCFQFPDTLEPVLPVSRHILPQLLQLPQGLAGSQRFGLQSRLLGI